jgi:hypothetical protein
LSASAQDRVQIKEFRARFVGQQVVINGNFSDLPWTFLGDWHFLKEQNGIYQVDYEEEVPVSLVGHSGAIIAVQAPKGSGPPADQSDAAFVEYAEAIVKLDTGQLLQTALYTFKTGSEPSDAFTLSSVKERHKQEAAALARQLTGKSLYLTHLTRIYDAGLTTENIETIKAGIGYSEARILDFPLLTPIPVLETRYSPQRDFTLILLQLPGGRKALYIPGCIEETPSAKKYECAFTSMPTFLTKREVEAIRKGSVFIGMSEPALYMLMGFPDHTNESLVGHTQLVYLTAYIYIDNDKKVVEVQSHD